MAITNGPKSPKPQSLPSGSTTDPPYWPLAQCGAGNPFFYHMFEDDFDDTISLYTASGGGTAAHVAGDGGLVTLTTLATASAFESIQPPGPGFTLPGTGNAPPGTSLSTKKLFYLARLQYAHVSTDSFLAGLIATTATPFSAGADNTVDGMYFYKAAGGTTLQFINRASAGNSPTGSAILNAFNLTLPTGVLASATNLDLAFWIDSYQNIRVWVASQLVGFFFQSGSGPTAPDGSGVTVNPLIGPIFANYNYQAQFTSVTGQVFVNPLVFTTANLGTTLAVSNGTTAAVTTMTADFHMAAKER